MIMEPQLVEEVKRIAVEAGNIIIDIYNGNFEGTIEKKNDNSPVTIADKKANDYIVNSLAKLNSTIPIITEENESIPYDIRKNYKEYWIVDPLDGTREFISKNGEFTINIALIKGNKPILGVVYIPVKKHMYWAVKNEGAYASKDGITNKIKANTQEKQSKIKVLLSRSCDKLKTNDFLKKFNTPIIEHVGSSIKFLRVAEGSADLYFRFTPTMEWDIAASCIILEEAGGFIKNIHDNSDMVFGKPDLKNPGFIAFANNQIYKYDKKI